MIYISVVNVLFQILLQNEPLVSWVGDMKLFKMSSEASLEFDELSHWS